MKPLRARVASLLWHLTRPLERVVYGLTPKVLVRCGAGPWRRAQRIEKWVQRHRVRLWKQAIKNGEM